MHTNLDDIMTSDNLSALGTWRSMEQPTEPKLDSIAWQIDAAWMIQIQSISNPPQRMPLEQRAQDL